jgi:preprotein translocase subunit SecG
MLTLAVAVILTVLLQKSGPENAGVFTSDKVYDKRSLSYSRLRKIPTYGNDRTGR